MPLRHARVSACGIPGILLAKETNSRRRHRTAGGQGHKIAIFVCWYWYRLFAYSMRATMHAKNKNHSQSNVESLHQPGLEEGAISEEHRHLTLGKDDPHGHQDAEAVQRRLRALPRRRRTATKKGEPQSEPSEDSRFVPYRSSPPFHSYPSPPVVHRCSPRDQRVAAVQCPGKVQIVLRRSKSSRPAPCAFGYGSRAR